MQGPMIHAGTPPNVDKAPVFIDLDLHVVNKWRRDTSFRLRLHIKTSLGPAINQSPRDSVFARCCGHLNIARIMRAAAESLAAARLA